MVHKLSSLLGALLLALLVAVPAAADPGQPNFMPAIYGDGEVWGTKGTTDLPAPKGNNDQSFDQLFRIANGPYVESSEQLPVSEAAPGNPNYNGGRWVTRTVIWADDATPILLTSYEQILEQLALGHLTIDASNPTYFQCPLLPVK
jgi:hypothetical protein